MISTRTGFKALERPQSTDEEEVREKIKGGEKGTQVKEEIKGRKKSGKVRE